MSMTQPLQARLSPMIGLGMVLLTMMVVGEAFVSEALSPGAQPGKPPDGVQSPEVSVQFALGGGALAVTVYTVGMQIANAAAVPSTARTINVTPQDVTIVRSLRRST